jgi:riboflavin kinase/FMN adenylyltransferase
MSDKNPEGFSEIVRFQDLSPKPYLDSCLTIGNFDGVHLGHQAIIRRMVQDTKQSGSPLIVVTLYPNPSVFLKKRPINEYLSTPDEKEKMLRELGVDEVVTFKFDEEFANLKPEIFISGLVDNLQMRVLVVGPDFAMGKGRQGSRAFLDEAAGNLKFSIKAAQPVLFEDLDVSSTRIRRFLDEGNVKVAAKLLGRYYDITGTVVHGSDRGSRIGLPTANLSYWHEKKRPAIGVYATHVTLDEVMYQAITNVGYRPTFETQTVPNIESHILGFDGNIYGECLTLTFIDKIRDELKFDSVNAFLAQIEQDKETAREIFTYAETPPYLSSKPQESNA